MKEFIYCPMCAAELRRISIEGKNRLSCTTCSWVNYLNPVPVVACLVRNSQGEVLLVKRAVEPGIGKWSLPSGFLELDETPREAALRELEEETGLKGSAVKLIGVYTQCSEMYGTVLTVGYLMEAVSGRLKPGDDASDAKFCRVTDPDEIPFESHRKMLEETEL